MADACDDKSNANMASQLLLLYVILEASIMYREEPRLAHPPPDATLWRYMDFTKFVSILEKDALFFPRADKLGDPYEGFLPERLLETLRISFSNQTDPRSNIYWNITQVFRTVCAFTLISCWHESPDESAAMWRCYAESNNGIAIKTTLDHCARV